MSGLEQAGRSAHYSQAEIENLAFAGSPPDGATLSRRWRDMQGEAHAIVEALPAEHAGTCVLDSAGALLAGGVAELRCVLAHDGVRYHRGALRGALPRIP